MKFYPRISHRAIMRRALACSLFVVASRGFAQEQAAPQPAVAAVPTEEEKTVRMEEFKVTADLDSYHQTTSSMATKLPMDVKELASSLTIMNAAAIKDRNAVTLLDVVNYVVGANQSQGNINGFSFRGFPNTGSYTQNIQFDGLQGATLKKAATSAANVDSIEFLKGPNGVLYGQMNPGGLLNIVTKSPMEVPETDLRVTMGTYAGASDSFGSKFTRTASFDVTGPVGDSKHLFYRLVADAESAPSSRPGNWDHALSYYPSATYKWTPENYLTVKAEVSLDSRRQDDGLIPIFNNNTAYGPTATWYTAPLNTVYEDSKDKATDRGEALSAFFHAALPGGLTLRVQSRSVWHVDVTREWTVNSANVRSPSSAYTNPTSLIRRQYNQLKNGHRYNYIDANIFRSFDFGAVNQTVILGIGGGGEFFGNRRVGFGPNQTVGQAITLINPIIDQVPDYPADGTGATGNLTYQTALGEYISDQIKVGNSLHLSVGIRHDHQKVQGVNTLNPAKSRFWNDLEAYTKQAGILYDVTPNFSPYASWSQSIKPQTVIAFDASGNSRFPPESGEQYEGGIKFASTTKNLNATLAVYEINRTNVLVPSGTSFAVDTGAALAGQQISRLDGKQTSKGVELELQWQPVPNWQMQAGFAYSKATITGSIKNPTTVGLDLANAPRKTGSFWTRYNVPSGKLKGLGVGTGVVYVGQSWGGDPTTSVYFLIPSWTRVDSAVYYQWKRYNCALSIQNLLDRKYIPGAFSANVLNVGEQRKLTFSVETRF